MEMVMLDSISPGLMRELSECIADSIGSTLAREYTVGTQWDFSKEANMKRDVEIKTRTSAEVKEAAAEIYSHWGLSLSDAVNMFLVKSIDVGGLPFEAVREKPLPYEVRKAMLIAEAQEFGIIPDDSTTESEVPDEVLASLGLTKEEVAV